MSQLLLKIEPTCSRFSEDPPMTLIDHVQRGGVLCLIARVLHSEHEELVSHWHVATRQQLLSWYAYSAALAQFRTARHYRRSVTDAVCCPNPA